MPRRTGLTLIELMVSLIITSLIAVAVASVIHAGAYGTSSRREVRRLVVQTQELRMRLSDTVRLAQAVLACGQGAGGEKYIVLWTGDSNRDGDEQVNLSELQFVEWTPAAQRLTSYRVSAKPDPDPSYPPDSNFYTLATQLRNSGVLVGTVWAKDVSAFEIALDDAKPTAALRATWALTLTSDLVSEPIVATVALRSPRPPK